MNREPVDCAEMASRVKESAFFSRYSKSDLVRHLEMLEAEVRTYKKGEVLTSEGHPAERVGLILGGAVHIALELVNGKRSIMEMAKADYLLGGIILLVPQERHLCTLVAFNDCEVLTISTARALAWKSDPSSSDFYHAVEMQQFRFLRDTARKCVILSQPSVEKRIMTYLNVRCHDERTRTITVDGTEADFANYLGVHVVSVSRALNKLRSEGLIDYQRNVLTLIDVDE